ncbi:hypothetical protein EYC84_002082 [Monilinia fructicola]|uniref:Uncharacterized protein n=1 Tax=Monilinia fructicola TaxID=38448 RepID=A0A5M9JSD6_MONFR|nr:hypothetical protein EYC84_002082 [Monilinia fructicola]
MDGAVESGVWNLELWGNLWDKCGEMLRGRISFRDEWHGYVAGEEIWTLQYEERLADYWIRSIIIEGLCSGHESIEQSIKNKSI